MKTEMQRRRFIRQIGAFSLITVSASMLPGGISRAHARTFSVLSGQEAATLIAMAKQLFPHPKVPNSVYADVVADLDQQAKKNKALSRTLKDGTRDLAKLNRAPFAKLREEDQIRAIQKIENSDFFDTVRAAALGIYDNPLVWADIGFEGECYSKGGYLYRGFNDLDWLPDPPDLNAAAKH